MNSNVLKELISKNQVKQGNRVPYHVDNYLSRYSQDLKKSKYDLINEFIAKNIPDKLSDILDSDEYESIVSQAKKNILKMEDNNGELATLLRKIIIFDESTMVASAKQLSEIIFRYGITTIERNNFIKLITFKKSYLQEIANDIMSDKNVKEAFNKSLENLNKILNDIYLNI